MYVSCIALMLLYGHVCIVYKRDALHELFNHSLRHVVVSEVLQLNQPVKQLNHPSRLCELQDAMHVGFQFCIVCIT